MGQLSFGQKLQEAGTYGINYSVVINVTCGFGGVNKKIDTKSFVLFCGNGKLNLKMEGSKEKPPETGIVNSENGNEGSENESPPNVFGGEDKLTKEQKEFFGEIVATLEKSVLPRYEVKVLSGNTEVNGTLFTDGRRSIVVTGGHIADMIGGKVGDFLPYLKGSWGS